MLSIQSLQNDDSNIKVNSHRGKPECAGVFFLQVLLTVLNSFLIINVNSSVPEAVLRVWENPGDGRRGSFPQK